MEPEFWHQAWAEQRIGFHASAVNPDLVKHWPTLGLAPGARVLVPLCGKTLDLAWLAEQGHRVTGVELSGLACGAWAEQHGLTPEVVVDGRFTAWTAGPITLLQGDVFDLGPERGPFDAVYDRAATVALPPELRARYAAHLATLVAPGAPMLLLTFDYPQEDREGPPFSVPEANVRALYGDAFAITHLDRYPIPAERFGVAAHHDAWRLVRR